MNRSKKIRKAAPDNLRRRAEARALLLDPNQGPRIFTEYVGVSRDSKGQLVGPNLDFKRAEVAGRTLERGEGESVSDFQTRVEAEMPAVGVSEARFYSDDETTAA